MVTIITPTYNRGKEIKELYKSLIKQTDYGFKWLIIDDGSVDNTKKIVEKFSKEKFDITYIYKENGGKHTALNLAFGMLKTELMLIVDSDDTLVPDAIETINNDWKKYKCNKKIAGLVYKKKRTNNELVGSDFKADEFEENYNSYVINQNIRGDKEEVFRSDIIKKYRYPEYAGEKFVGEGVVWSKIARNYNMIFINKPIYLCEYLEGGLTKSGRKMRINNPLGGMFHAEEYLDKIYSIKVRVKNAILYTTYALFAKKNLIDLYKNNKNKGILIISLIPSIILYFIWKKKYK